MTSTTFSLSDFCVTRRADVLSCALPSFKERTVAIPAPAVELQFQDVAPSVISIGGSVEVETLDDAQYTEAVLRASGRGRAGLAVGA